MADIAPSPLDVIDVTTIADLLRGAARDWDGDALVFPGERVTYRELEERAHRLARGLRALGVGRGDKVAIFMPNCADYCVSVFAIAKLGAVSVPLNGRFKAFELGYVIDHSDARVLLVADLGPQQAEDFRLVAEVLPGIEGQDAAALDVETAPALRQVVDLGHGQRSGILARADLEALVDRVPSEEVDLLQRRVRVRDVGVLMYTSGTTSQPKGCLITHEAIVRQGAGAGARPVPRAGRAMLGPAADVPHRRDHAADGDDVARAVLPPGSSSRAPRSTRSWPSAAGRSTRCSTRSGCRCSTTRGFPEADLSHVRAIFLVGAPEKMRAFQDRMPWLEVVVGLRDDGVQRRTSRCRGPAPTRRRA